VQNPAYKHNLAFVSKRFAAKKLKLIADIYHGVHAPLAYRCLRCSYLGRFSFNDLRSKGCGCRKCGIKRGSSARKLDFQKFKTEAKARGIEVLSSVYTNVETKLKFGCLQCQHEWAARPHHIRRGVGCPRCGHRRAGRKTAYTSEFVSQVLARNKIILLSDYQTSPKPIKVRFEKCGHEVWTNWSNIQSGRGCSLCAPNRRATEEDYNKTAEKFGGRILTIGSHANNNSKWKCSLGHVFIRNLSSVRTYGTFCTICSGSYAETLCRLAIEKLFGRRFCTKRIQAMRSLKGRPLELDIYNEDLRLAVEHNGAHHYEPQQNWSGDEGLRIQRIHDLQRRRFCKANGILLVEIRDLGKCTSLEEMREKLRHAFLKAGRKIPACFNNAELRNFPSLNRSQIYWVNVQEAARRMGLVILSRVFLGADIPMTVRCEHGHVTPKRPRSILRGHNCIECFIGRLSKPLQLSDGRVFASGVAAARALGVNKGAVNTAVRKNTRCKGITFKLV
jgi:DNA-directed RNA polymerase subunit RPC12/RpoP